MTKAERKVATLKLKEACIKRDGYKCLRCGSTKKLHLSHIYPKGEFRWMEFILDNVKLLCFRCHLQWWHKNPVDAAIWYIKTISAKRRAKLRKLAQTKPNGKKEKVKGKRKSSRRV